MAILLSVCDDCDCDWFEELATISESDCDEIQKHFMEMSDKFRADGNLSRADDFERYRKIFLQAK